MELRVAARELDWGGAMLCLLRCPAGEDDIDIGGCVLEVLHARVDVGHLLLLGGGVLLVLLPPWRWWDDVILFCGCHYLFKHPNTIVNKISFK